MTLLSTPFKLLVLPIFTNKDATVIHNYCHHQKHVNWTTNCKIIVDSWTIIFHKKIIIDFETQTIFNVPKGSIHCIYLSMTFKYSWDSTTWYMIISVSLASAKQICNLSESIVSATRRKSDIKIPLYLSATVRKSLA